MTRMPQIGDSARRIVDGKVKMSGYIHSFENEYTAVFVSDSNIKENGKYVSHSVDVLALVRGLGGWRWTPFDARPQVGDALLEERAVRMGVRYIIVAFPTSPGGILTCVVASPPQPKRSWNCTNEEGRDRMFDLPAADLAKAIAGVDGWSWEPARWSGSDNVANKETK
jgi:hypothetical protein